MTVAPSPPGPIGVDDLDAATLPLPLARVLLRFVEESPEVCRRRTVGLA
jgi:hypothetical protein